MSEFSPTEAALEGLRITRERPIAVLWWWAAYVIAALVQIGVSALPPFNHLAAVLPDLQAASIAVQQNPTDAAASQHFMGLIGRSAPAFVAFAALVLLIQMILSTAVLRAVLRPAERAAGYLRLSLDEVRQLGLALLMFAAFVAYAFVVSLASGVVVGVLGMFLGKALPILGGLAFALVTVAFIYPVVRLSLAPAMTLADGRISFMRSWALTQGRFWPLFGAYIVAFIIAFALWAAIYTLVAILLLVSGVDAKAAAESGAAMRFSPVFVALLLANGLLGALISVIVTAPMASAFRQITGRVGAQLQSRATAGSPWGQP